MKFSKFAAILLSIYYTAFAIGVVCFIVAICYLTKPAGNGERDVIFTVQEGEGFSSIAAGLEKKGLVRSRYALYPIAWINNEMSSIKAGSYRIDDSMPPEDILRTLVQGRVLAMMLTIPEGYNMFQIARVVERAGFDTRERFLATANNKNFLSSIGISHESAEGFLFPDTYQLEEKADSMDIISMMVKHFFTVWKENGFSKRASEMGLDMFKTIILASIVEEEAMLDQEKPLIASVFHNRLKRKMPFQADPTVKYGILVEDHVNRRRLRTKDLRRFTPYNTYRIKGFPAGPISNPGIVSIRAVLYPADTDYLFFVSMNNRRHKFSTTLKEHNRAVRRYQLKKSQ